MYAGYKMQQPARFNPPAENNQPATGYPFRQKLEDVLSYLQSKYVDSLNHGEVTDFLIDQLVFALDPYSEYLTPPELVSLEDRFDGRYQGAGITFRLISGRVYIAEMDPQGPARAAGVEPGDLVTRINGHILTDSLTALDTVLGFAREDAEKMHLTLQRAGESQPRTVDIEKADLSNRSTGPVFSPGRNTFYFKINSFSGTTYREFMKAVEEHVYHQDQKNLIIDLRSNSGGILGSAADILNQLIEEPDMVMFYTRDKNNQKREYKSTGRPFFRFGKIAVLINDETASASEVLAGVLQDLRRATIIGAPSFGKATVLEVFPLADGSSLELANARIFLPSGRCIQKPYNVRPDSNMHWLSPYQADTGEISSGSFCYPGGRGIIPDFLMDDVSVQDEDQQMITQLARDFTLLHYQELSALRKRTNNKALSSAYVLKNWINEKKDPFLLRHKEDCVKAVFSALLRFDEGEDKEEEARLLDDPLVSKALETVSAGK